MISSHDKNSNEKKEILVSTRNVVPKKMALTRADTDKFIEKLKKDRAKNMVVEASKDLVDDIFDDVPEVKKEIKKVVK